MNRAIRCAAAALAVAVLAGCAAVDIDEAVREADTRAGAFTGDDSGQTLSARVGVTF